jgi:hypothetical protein
MVRLVGLVALAGLELRGGGSTFTPCVDDDQRAVGFALSSQGVEWCFGRRAMSPS